MAARKGYTSSTKNMSREDQAEIYSAINRFRRDAAEGKTNFANPGRSANADVQTSNTNRQTATSNSSDPEVLQAIQKLREQSNNAVNNPYTRSSGADYITTVNEQRKQQALRFAMDKITGTKSLISTLTAPARQAKIREAALQTLLQEAEKKNDQQRFLDNTDREARELRRKLNQLPETQINATNKKANGVTESLANLNNQRNGLSYGVLKGLGYSSLINAADALSEKLTGQKSPSVQQMNQAIIDAQREAPGAFTAGNVAGQIGLITGIGQAVNGVSALSKLPNIANVAATGAATRGISSAISGAGDVATGKITPGKYAADIGVNAVAGAAGGAASNYIPGSVGELIKKYPNLQYNPVVRAGLAGLAGGTYSTASETTKQLARMLGYNDGQRVTAKQIAQDAIVGAAFGTINFILNGGIEQTLNEGRMASGGPKPVEEYYFKGVSDDQLKSAYRNLARELHPDNGGDPAAFDAMRKEFMYRESLMAGRAQSAYQAATQAKAGGNMEAYQAANDEFKTSVENFMTVYGEENINTPEMAQAFNALAEIANNGIDADIEVPTTLPTTPPITGSESPATEMMMKLAGKAVANKEAQRQALYNAGKNHEQNIQPLMDSATMLTEEEKFAALRQGNQDATQAEIEAVNEEVANNEETSIKEQVKNHSNELNAMEPVSKVTKPVSIKNLVRSDKAKFIAKLFSKNKFHVADVGDVIVDEKRINNSLRYIKTDLEFAAYQAIPEVLQNGKVIDKHINHKGRKHGTVTIAAPVDFEPPAVPEEMAGRYNVAVVVKQTTDNFYKVHRVVASDENVGNKKQTLHPSEAALPEIPTIGSAETDSVSVASGSNVLSATTESSINNIPSEPQTVKENLNVRAEQTGADSLRGRSIRVLSQRTGESAGGIQPAAGGAGEAGNARTYADPEAEVLRIREEIEGTEIINTAVPGQKVYTVEGDTEETSRAKAIGKAIGASKVTLYASETGGISVSNGDRVLQSRGSYAGEPDSIAVSVNDSRATAAQIMGHEGVERGIRKGLINPDTVYNTIKAEDEMISTMIDDVVDTYVHFFGQPDTTHALKELLCDIGGEINQYKDLKGWEDVAATVDGLSEIIRPMLNEALGGALDAKPELPASAVANTPDPAATFSEQNNSKAVDYSIDQISQATGYQLVRNSEGVPYTLMDPATGKEVRPKDITPDKIRNSPQGRMIAASEKSGIIDAKTADAQRKFTADLMKMIVQYKDQATVWEISGTTAFSSFKANSDSQYGSTVDFGTICSKTQPIVDTMSNTMVEKGRGLKRDEVLKVYDAVAKTGLSVPCPVCYVFSRWVGVPSLLETMRRGQERFGENTTAEAVNAYIKRMESTYNGKEGINNAKVKAQGKVQKLQNDLLKARGNDKEIGRIAKETREVEKELADLEIYNWVTQVRCKTDSKRNPIRDKNGMVTLDPKYKSVPNDVLLNLNRTGEFARDYPKQWLYRTTRGAGMGKAILPYSGAGLGDAVRGAGIAKPSQYAKGQNPFFNGDEKKAVRDITNARKRMRAQNLIGGQRLQSTSDFRAEWGIDYIVDMMEMQNVGAKGQLYTKVLEAVDLLATAGNEVNISAMGKGDGYHLDSKGRPVLGLDDFSNVTGVDIRAALQYVKKYDNAQIILVGLNDIHTRLALADDRIGFVIPWHASGSSEDVLRQLMASNNEELKNGTDYTPVQDDHVIDYGDKELNAEKKSMRDLRKAIVMGKLKKGVSTEQQALLDKNEWLQDLYNRYYVDENAEEYGVKLSGKQAEKIFPYEYWDKSLTVKDADQNGLRFQEYCASLGLKPRFSGAVVDGKEIGNFANDPGYWKLLIDRSMYNLDGTYHEPQVIDVTKIKIDQVPMTVNSNLYRDDSKLKQATMDSLKALDEQPNDVAMTLDVSDSEISEDAVDYSTELDIPERDSSWLDDLLIDEILAELKANTGQEPMSTTKTIAEDTGLRADRRTDRVKKRLHDLGLEFNGSKKVGWTSDRIDTYLDGNHFASSNPNYAQAYIAYISPKDYLSLTLGSNENTINRIEEETSMMGDIDMSKLDKDYLQPMFLNIMDEKETRASVAGHEGRHRMLLLGKAGFDRVPVLVFNSRNKYEKHFKPTLTLKPENQTGGFISKTREVTLHDVIPFSQGNRDIIMDTFGPDANDVSYSTALNIEGMTPEEIDAAYKEKFAKHRKELEERRRQRRDIRKARAELLKKANKAVKLSKNRPGYASEAIKDLVKDLDLVSVGMREATKDKLREKYFEILQMRQQDPNYAALHSEKDMERVERLFKTQIKDMDIDDVRDLITELSALIHYQETQNKLFKDSKNRTAAEAGRQWVMDLEELKPLDITNGVKQLGVKYLRNNLSPERAVRMISGYKRGSVAGELVRNIEDGLTKQKEFEQKADQLFRPFLEDKANADFVKNASKQTIQIKDADGKTAMISPAMRVALYMHRQNVDNMKHIASGGVTIPNSKLYEQGKYYDAYDRGRTLKLQPTDIDEIIADMTPSEIEYANRLVTFFDTYAKDAINDASMTLDGILRAVVDNYFPITSDKNFLAKAMDLVNDPTLEGWNNLKARQEGSINPIMLEDVTKVLQRHITKTGQYYGLAVPLRDFQKVYGYTSSGYETSVQKAIGKVWDADTKKYLEQWITDLNTGGRQAEKGILDTMRGAYAGAVLTLNPSVALKQTTSYSMAGSILDFGSLMYGLEHRFTKDDQEYMDSITPWGWARRQGQSTIELGDLAKQKQSIANKIPNWNQAMDVWTTNRLFLAAEKSVQKEYPDLKRGDEKYDKALAEKYNQILWRTQPQYEAMFRPEYLRKTDIGSRTFGMFKTESMQMSGELIDAWSQWRADSARAKDGSDQSRREKSESAKRFYKTLSSWLVSNMMFAAFGSAISLALMHKGKQYRDEKGEITLNSIAKQTAKQFGSSVFGEMFLLGNAYDVGQYLFDVIHSGSGNWYDIEAPGLSLINDVINNSGNMIGTIMNEEANAEAKRKAIAKFVMSISKFTPVGFAENLYNTLNSLNLYIQDGMQGTLGRYEAGKGLLADTSPDKGQYAKMAVNAAKNGDFDTAARALENTNKTQLAKALGTKVSEKLYERFLANPENLASYLNSGEPKLSDVPNAGYSSFTKLREALGDPERTQNWHHIVEQKQTDDGLAGFRSDEVNNTNNIVSIPSGTKSPHSAITKYYDSVQDFTDGKTVREWLADKSFEEQWEFGVEQLEKYGDLIPTDKGWVYVPDEEKIEEMMPLSEGTGVAPVDPAKYGNIPIDAAADFQIRKTEAGEDGGVTKAEIQQIIIDMMTNGTLDIHDAENLYSSQLNGKPKEAFDKYAQDYDAIDAYFGMIDAKSAGNQDGVVAWLNKSNYSEEMQRSLWAAASYDPKTFDKKVLKKK